MTGLMDLFKEALEYPTKDFKALLIFGVIFLISSLSSVLTSWGIEIPGSALALLGLISFVLYFVYEGYTLSVLRESIDLKDEIPALDIVANFIDRFIYRSFNHCNHWNDLVHHFWIAIEYCNVQIS